MSQKVKCHTKLNVWLLSTRFYGYLKNSKKEPRKRGQKLKKNNVAPKKNNKKKREEKILEL